MEVRRQGINVGPHDSKRLINVACVAVRPNTVFVPIGIRLNPSRRAPAELRNAFDNSLQHFTELDEKAFFPGFFRCGRTAEAAGNGILQRTFSLLRAV